MIMLHRKIGNVVFGQMGTEIAIKYKNRTAFCNLRSDRRPKLSRDWMPLICLLRQDQAP